MSIPWNAAESVVHKAQQLEKLPFTLPLFLAFLLGLVFLFSLTNNRRPRTSPVTPPGTLGWPLIGETLQLLACRRRGKPNEFFDSRTQKYGKVFTTSLVGYPTVVFCSPEGNRFLFANENKLVTYSWPSSVRKLFGSAILNASGDDAKRIRRMLLTFLRPDALQKFVGQVDLMTKHHLAEHWIGKDEVTVFPLVKLYTFSLACELFASIYNSDDQAQLSHHFMALQKGLLQIPLDLPGTPYNRAKRGVNAIREQLEGIIFAGHDTSNSTLTVLLKFLAENPDSTKPHAGTGGRTVKSRGRYRGTGSEKA